VSKTEKEKFMEIAEALYDSGYGMDLSLLRERLVDYGLISRVKIVGILNSCATAIDCQLAHCDHGDVDRIRSDLKQCKVCGRTSYGFEKEGGGMWSDSYEWDKWKTKYHPVDVVFGII